MTGRLIGIDHIQLAMPAGGEADAEAFYAGVLGLSVVPKPEPLQARGGCWFATADIQLHLGVEPDFRAANKAHPAFLVDDLEELAKRLDAAGHRVRWDTALPGTRRCYVNDPFGNRIELIAAPQATHRW